MSDLVKNLQAEGYMVDDLYVGYVLSARLIEMRYKKDKPIWDKDAIARLKDWLKKMGRAPIRKES